MATSERVTRTGGATAKDPVDAIGAVLLAVAGSFLWGFPEIGLGVAALGAIATVCAWASRA